MNRSDVEDSFERVASIVRTRARRRLPVPAVEEVTADAIAEWCVAVLTRDDIRNPFAMALGIVDHLVAHWHDRRSKSAGAPISIDLVDEQALVVRAADATSPHEFRSWLETAGPLISGSLRKRQAELLRCYLDGKARSISGLARAMGVACWMTIATPSGGFGIANWFPDRGDVVLWLETGTHEIGVSASGHMPRTERLQIDAAAPIPAEHVVQLTLAPAQ